MQSFVFLTYFVHKLSKKTLGGSAGKGRVKDKEYNHASVFPMKGLLKTTRAAGTLATEPLTLETDKSPCECQFHDS